MTKLSLVAVGVLALWGCGDDSDDNPPCKTDADCTLPQQCAADGLCRAPDPADAGEPCLHPEHCKSKLCLDTGEGGVCSVACAGPAQCAAGQVCAPVDAKSVPPDAGGKSQLRLLCQAPGPGERHLNEACTGDDQCRSRICDDEGRCTQPCDASATGAQECPGSLVCEETSLAVGGGSLSTGVCRRQLLDAQEIGPVDVPKTGMTSPVTFTVAEGVTSFLLFADDTDNLHVVFKKLEGPDGTVYVNYDDRANELARAYDRTGTATVQVPGTDNPKGAVQAGTYKLWIQTYKWVNNDTTMEPEAGKLERVALLTRRSGQKGGLLDLELHFSPATGLKAATAKDDAYVKASLAELAALYNRMMGVGLGQVRYHDLPASEDTVKDWDHVGQLRTQYAKEGPNKLSVNIFVVNKIAMGYTGLAGGIPGVPGLAGRPVSGAVVEKQSDGKKMGRMLGHEIGHFLGLYHTTESQKGPFKVDLFSDTPECPSGTQADKCPDFHNQMFPFYYQAPDPLVLSRGQAMAVRGSPFFYELAYPEACGAGTDPVSDVTASGFGSGTTSVAGAGRLQSSCGGAGKAERVHLYRLTTTGLKSLEVQALSDDFDPVVYVLSGSCGTSPGGAEVGCQTAKKGAAATVTIDSPQAGAYYVVVDSDTGTGSYRLTVREIK
jgi:hypothetical protein